MLIKVKQGRVLIYYKKELKKKKEINLFPKKKARKNFIILNAELLERDKKHISEL